MAQPIRSTCSRIAAVDIATEKPGIASSLSSVPPVCPRPRPDIFAKASPAAAIRGTSTSEVLSPTPPVLCLSTTGRPRCDQSSCEPLETSACV
jgi:hypothetical protein